MHELDWGGMPNLRDRIGLAGGYGTTRFGRVARGPRREFMTGPGWRQARERGLRSVADLRRPFECGRRTGDPVVPGDILAGVSVHATPIEDHDNAGSWQPAARLGNDYANCCFKANAPSGTRRHPMRPGCWTRRAPCRLPAANLAIPVDAPRANLA